MYKDNEIYEDFEEGVINENLGIVTFTLKEEKTDIFGYYLKIEAEGGEFYWSTVKIFKSYCGPLSAQI